MMKFESKIIIALCAAGFILSILAFFPGWMNSDAVDQLGQAKNNSYVAWHPVGMAWYWNKLIKIYDGPALMLLTNIILYWSGWGIFAYAIKRREEFGFCLIPLFGFCPAILYPLGEIWKDVLFACILFFLWSVLYLAHTQKRNLTNFERIIIITGAFFSFSVKTNGLVVLPFIFSFMYYSDNRMKKFFKNNIVASMLMTTATPLVVYSLFTSLDIKNGYYFQYIEVYDLLGITARTGKNYFPEYINERIGDKYNAFVLDYNPKSNDKYFYPLHLLTFDSDKFYKLSCSWSNAVMKNPVQYLSHRASIFLKLFSIGETSTPFVASPLIETHPIDFGYRFHANIFSDLLVKIHGKYPYLFFQWIICLVLVLAFLFLLYINFDKLFILHFGFSAFAFILPHFFVAPASEYRFLYYPFICSIFLSSIAVQHIVNAFFRKHAKFTNL